MERLGKVCTLLGFLVVGAIVVFLTRRDDLAFIDDLGSTQVRRSQWSPEIPSYVTSYGFPKGSASEIRSALRTNLVSTLGFREISSSFGGSVFQSERDSRTIEFWIADAAQPELPGSRSGDTIVQVFRPPNWFEDFVHAAHL